MRNSMSSVLSLSTNFIAELHWESENVDVLSLLNKVLKKRLEDGIVILHLNRYRKGTNISRYKRISKLTIGSVDADVVLTIPHSVTDLTIESTTLLPEELSLLPSSILSLDIGQDLQDDIIDTLPPSITKLRVRRLYTQRIPSQLLEFECDDVAANTSFNQNLHTLVLAHTAMSLESIPPTLASLKIYNIQEIPSLLLPLLTSISGRMSEKYLQFLVLTSPLLEDVNIHHHKSYTPINDSLITWPKTLHTLSYEVLQKVPNTLTSLKLNSLHDNNEIPPQLQCLTVNNIDKISLMKVLQLKTLKSLKISVGTVQIDVNDWPICESLTSLKVKVNMSSHIALKNNIPPHLTYLSLTSPYQYDLDGDKLCMLRTLIYMWIPAELVSSDSALDCSILPCNLTQLYVHSSTGIKNTHFLPRSVSDIGSTIFNCTERLPPSVTKIDVLERIEPCYLPINLKRLEGAILIEDIPFLPQSVEVLDVTMEGRMEPYACKYFPSSLVQFTIYSSEEGHIYKIGDDKDDLEHFSVEQKNRWTIQRGYESIYNGMRTSIGMILRKRQKN